MTAIHPAAWTDGALCAQVDPELWFPEPWTLGLDAIAICRACPVRTPCLKYALDRPGTEGVWGGLSERDRAKFGRQYRRGVPVEDIITVDDAMFYARTERDAAEAEATAARERARSHSRRPVAREKEKVA